MEDTSNKLWKIRKMNRHNAKNPKSGLFWCWKCDRDAVGDGQKCPSCGALSGKKRLKKQDIVFL